MLGRAEVSSREVVRDLLGEASREIELDQPFGGMIRISSVPARAALALIGH